MAEKKADVVLRPCSCCILIVQLKCTMQCSGKLVNNTYPRTSVGCYKDAAEDKLRKSLTDVLEQLKDFHHVHVPVVTLRVLDEGSSCEPDGYNGNHEEIEHPEDEDDDDILQHGLELSTLPDQKDCKEEDSDGHGKDHEEDAELIISAAYLINLS